MDEYVKALRILYKTMSNFYVSILNGRKVVTKDEENRVIYQVEKFNDSITQVQASSLHSHVMIKFLCELLFVFNKYGKLALTDEIISYSVVLNIYKLSKDMDFELPPISMHVEMELEKDFEKAAPLRELMDGYEDRTPLEFKEVERISCGSLMTILITENSVNSVGENSFGTIFGRDTREKTIEIDEIEIKNVVSFSNGRYHAVAVKSDGTILTWGRNECFQLGIGDEVNTTMSLKETNITTKDIVPKYVDIKDVISAKCGNLHTVALKSDGTVWVWGENLSYQLGLGHDFDDVNIPVQLEFLNHLTITEISVCESTNLALSSDGTVWAWGNNKQGQLGIGHNKEITKPEKIEKLENIIKISNGPLFCLALDADGTVWSWGENEYGQLGNDTTKNEITPVKVMALKNIVDIKCGETHCLALDEYGVVWAWGSNKYGQLGNGTTKNQLHPILVINDIKYMVAGYQHSFFVKNNGDIYSCGLNKRGQLLTYKRNNTYNPTIYPTRVNNPF